MLFRCGAISKIEHAQTLVKSESFDMREASNGNTDSVVDCLLYSCLQSVNITGCVNASERVDRPSPREQSGGCISIDTFTRVLVSLYIGW